MKIIKIVSYILKLRVIQGGYNGWESWKKGVFEKLGWKSWKRIAFLVVLGWKSWIFIFDTNLTLSIPFIADMVIKFFLSTCHQ